MTGAAKRKEYTAAQEITTACGQRTVPPGCRQSHSANHIEKAIYVDAPVSEVWLALVDPVRFGAWFRTKLDKPFRVNEYTHGTSTYPGCEHLRWRAVTETLDHERLLAFTWSPAPEDAPDNESQPDESQAVHTLVEITVRATVDGTRIIFRESGFEQVGDEQARAVLMGVRAEGWSVQADNIRQYIVAS